MRAPVMATEVTPYTCVRTDDDTTSLTPQLTEFQKELLVLCSFSACVLLDNSMVWHMMLVTSQ